MNKLKLKSTYEIAISPDATKLLTVSGYYIILWDVATGQKIYKCKPFKHPSHLAYSPTGDLFAAKNTSGEIAVVRTADGIINYQFDPDAGEGCELYFSACGKYLIDANWEGKVLVIDYTTESIKTELIYPGDQQAMVSELSCSCDRNTWLVNWYPKGGDKEYDHSIMGLVKWPFDKNKPTYIQRKLRLGKAILSPDGKKIATYYCTKLPPPISEFIEIMSLDGKTLMKIEVKDSPSAMGWSSKSRWFVYGYWGAFNFYDSEKDFECVATIESERPSSIAFSSDDAWVALGDWSNSIVISMESVVNQSK